jgi:glycerol-3-phosphate acyltransferase PlsY
MSTLIAILVGYCLGCFSTADYLVRWRTGQDIRDLGTGTAGARNVGRILGKPGFALTFLGDALKGIIAIAIARWGLAEGWGPAAVLVAVTLGHIYPVQLGFRGGKGAATAFGGVLALNASVGVAIILLAAVLVGVLRSFTTSGLIAIALAPVIAFLLGAPPEQIAGVAAAALLLLFAHRDNIRQMAQRGSTAG